MKRIVFAAIALAFSITATAHSGGTDAYGCHYDKKTGVYHCH